MTIFKKNNLACLLVLFACVIHILVIIFKLDTDSELVLIVYKDEVWKADFLMYIFGRLKQTVTSLLKKKTKQKTAYAG